MHKAILKLALTQHGAFSTSQAETEGVSRSSLCRECKRGALVRSAPAVYVLPDAPETNKQPLMVHLLAAGAEALATGLSAVALWCDEVPMPRRPWIAIPRCCGYRSPNARILSSTDLHLANAAVVDGIPTVGVARALIDLSADHTVDEVIAFINACQRQHHIAPGALAQALDVHARRGRKGIATFRKAVEALQREIPDSDFERRVIRDLIAAGIEPPRLHHVVRIRDQSPIELDLDWPGLLLDVELDGRDHMTRERKARRDRYRDRLLQALGYVVLRYTWDDYVRDREGMIAEIAAFVEQRRSANEVGL